MKVSKIINLPLNFLPLNRTEEEARSIEPFAGVQVFYPIEEGGNKLQIVAVDPARVTFRAVVKGKKDFLSLCSEGSRPKVIFNGNFFDKNQRILGLLISEGKVISQLSRASKLLTGIFFITYDDQARIVVRSEFERVNLEEVKFALQAGPLIIEPGSEKGIQGESGKKDYRTVVAVDKTGKILIFTFRTKVSFYEVQNLLLKNFPEIQAALNLDGGESVASCINSPSHKNLIPPFHNLPLVIQISPR